MPTTVVGVLIFVVLLVPGYCFLLGRRRFGQLSPSKYVKPTPLQELTTLVFASVICLLISLVVFAAVRADFPKHTPDIGMAARHGLPYVRTNYQEFWHWSLGIIALACVVGFLAGRSTWTQRVFALDPLYTQDSAWTVTFDDPDYVGHYKQVICHLNDGSVVEGTLWTYNPSSDEETTRDITLTGVSYVQPPGEVELRYDAGVIIISAASIRWMRVLYLNDEEYAEASSRRVREAVVAKRSRRFRLRSRR